MTLKRVLTAILCGAAMVAATGALAGCGASDAPCELETGEYHVALPDAPAPGNPAVFFVHGYGSSGAAVMRNSGLVDAVLARGYALIAPTGMPRGNGRGHSWSFHPDFPARRDELAFFRAVLDDAVDRFALNRDRVLMSGFSIGGSMVSYVACAAPDTFAAYAPVAGSFWRPHPDHCAGPVRLFHTHGWADATVPLEGRPLRGGALLQGDVFAALDIWRQTNACNGLKPDTTSTKGAFWRRSWENCAPDTALDFALFPGGHRVPQGWADMALDWFEAL